MFAEAGHMADARFHRLLGFDGVESLAAQAFDSAGFVAIAVDGAGAILAFHALQFRHDGFVDDAPLIELIDGIPVVAGLSEDYDRRG